MTSEHMYLGTLDYKVNLTDLTLNRDTFGYYLSAKYRIEDEHSIRELDIPKIRLRTTPKRVVIKTYDGVTWTRPEADIGFGFCELSHTGTKEAIYFTETVVEEKTHEMTLDEIEKKLGYKVKIVNSK